MDRQVLTRLTLYAAITVLAVVGALYNPRVFALAVLVPAAFAVGGLLLIGIPYATNEAGEGHRLGWARLLDFLEHGMVLAWLGLFFLWMSSFIAFMGLDAGGALATGLFAVAAPIGFVAALRDLFLSEEPDDMQAAWQHHPGA